MVKGGGVAKQEGPTYKRASEGSRSGPRRFRMRRHACPKLCQGTSLRRNREVSQGFAGMTAQLSGPAAAATAATAAAQLNGAQTS